MTQGQTEYLVATGIVVLRSTGRNPHEAIINLKERIRARGERPHFHDPDIGMSLATALAEGRLNFIVMDLERTELLGGEYQGVYEETVSRRLANSLRRQLPLRLYYSTDPETA